ncbi:sensor domain-containing diguanylate cyclase [Neorhizobium sp. NCHU2750]|uniref:GGDEF domain-containing protein n=1 Tax=Neorhizobium sp. NCHU2750 TaxID=1825976 RepID=UPI000E71FFED|nr:diguanylate cyclase [Neorhizobium sp. NCHU2750]
MSDSLPCHRTAPDATTQADAALSLPSTSERFNRLQELFDKSFKAARVGIWECTLPDEKLTWTDTVYELFGLQPQMPLVREATVALYTPESRRKLTEIRSATIRSGEGFTLDAEIITAKGDLRWIRITAIVERDNGVPVRLFGMKQDITAEKTLFDQLRRMAETDSVTGLASRTKFEMALDELVGAGPSPQKALLLIDLDNFKTVNDTLGHQAGDECLRSAGERLSQALPHASLIGRLGGDEFAIIHECASPQALHDIGQRVVDRLEWWVSSPENRIKVSASIGATMIVPGRQAKDIFAEADKALYAAKACGKNSFRLPPVPDPQVADPLAGDPIACVA